MQTTINDNAEKMRSEYNSTLWKERGLKQRRAAANTEGFRNWSAAQRRAAHAQETSHAPHGRAQAKQPTAADDPTRKQPHARAKQQ